MHAKKKSRQDLTSTSSSRGENNGVSKRLEGEEEGGQLKRCICLSIQGVELKLNYVCRESCLVIQSIAGDIWILVICAPL